VVHSTGTTKQRKSTKLLLHTALQNRRLHTTNTVGAKHFNSAQLYRHSAIIMQGSSSMREIKAF